VRVLVELGERGVVIRILSRGVPAYRARRTQPTDWLFHSVGTKHYGILTHGSHPNDKMMLLLLPALAETIRAHSDGYENSVNNMNHIREESLEQPTREAA
jgi:hypothetical protein